MIDVFISFEKPYPLKKQEIKKRTSEFFLKHGIKSHSQIEILVVGKDAMLGFVKEYLHETGEKAAEHPVLSFVQTEIEGPFLFPPDNILHLGEIIVSFDHAKEIALNTGKTPNETTWELIEHAALHLMGIHHK